jgi:hypothetical protein
MCSLIFCLLIVHVVTDLLLHSRSLIENSLMFSVGYFFMLFNEIMWHISISSVRSVMRWLAWSCSKVMLLMSHDRCYCRGSTYDAEFSHFLREDEGYAKDAGQVKIDGLSVQQAEAADKLSRLPAFASLIKNILSSAVRSPLLYALSTL